MGVGSGHEDNTHPSSTTFLFDSLVRSIAAHPFQRPEASTMPSSPASDKNGTSAPEPISTEEALATLSFIPADPEAPLPLLRLPREIIGHILHIVALTSIIPPPRQARVEEATAQDGQVAPRKGKRTLKRKTLKEEMEAIEMDLELEDVDRAWQSDVEALERFARTCRAGRILSLDNSIWRSVIDRESHKSAGCLILSSADLSACAPMSRRIKFGRRKTQRPSSLCTATTGGGASLSTLDCVLTGATSRSSPICDAVRTILGTLQVTSSRSTGISASTPA